MSKTIEEIKEERAQECLARNWSQLLVAGLTNTDVDYIAQRYAQSQTQELQEQNAELVMTLETIASLITNQTSMSTVKASLLQILTKHKHLNKK